MFYGSGEVLETSATGFSSQLIRMYTDSLGNWAYLIISVAAITTMFSTTLTTLDASPRVLERTTNLLSKNRVKSSYIYWLVLLLMGTLIIFFFFSSDLGKLVQIATVLSFLTAPFYAIINYKLITSNNVPEIWKPKIGMHILSWLGVLFLIGFGIWFITNH